MNTSDVSRERSGRRFSRRFVRHFAARLCVGLSLALLLLSSVAWAGPRSGASFGGRLGFRSGGGFSSSPSPSRSYGSSSYGSPSYGYGGPHFGFWPSFGWGGFGFGPSLGTLLVVGVIGFVAVNAIRSARRRTESFDDDEQVAVGRAYVYKLQLALGRSARGLQGRLESYASSGDTNSAAGLTSLLQQTALEVLREKDSIRYAAVDGAGPMNLTKAEEKLNELALGERSHFQVERVRAADGQVRKSEAARIEGREALELVVVTLLVATRMPLPGFDKVEKGEDVEAALRSIGRVTSQGLLGLEVVWTPADPDDSLTEMDVMATYPELRGV